MHKRRKLDRKGQFAALGQDRETNSTQTHWLLLSSQKSIRSFGSHSNEYTTIFKFVIINAFITFEKKVN